MTDERRTPVRPRDAASVVLVRGAGVAAEVLMGRRRSKAAFLPNIYVFPGGRVDVADIQAGRALNVPEAAIEPLVRRRHDAPARGLLVAALRETFEETGLLLAEGSDGWRAPAGLGTQALWRAMEEAGAAPALGRLHYIARAITPTMSHRRFNTRFFMADASHARGVLLAESELLDLRWVRIADASRTFPIVDVTQFVLKTAARHLAGRPDARVPLWRYIGDNPHVLWE
jgi:8-oxo-dGTP pyrophosphatase MutT (NUDIX family)